MAANVLNWQNACLSELPVGPRLARLEEIAASVSGMIASGALPFVTMDYADEALATLDALVPELARYEHMLVLGIGGSALGARALQKAFAPSQDWPGHSGKSLWICDNVDAIALPAWFDRLPAEKTLVVAISKSGGTIETSSQYFLARDWLKSRLPDAWREHLILVTDPAKGYFRKEAAEQGYKTLPVPPALGGRYSVLSAVGLLPAAFLGMDCRALVRGARAVMRPFAQGVKAPSLAGHPAWNLAVWAEACMAAGKSELIFFSYVPQWATFGPWFAQLWAESLGKQGKGSMPVPALGVTDQHSVNQMFLDGPRNKACLYLECESLPQGPAFSGDLPPDFAFLADKRFGELLQAEALGTRMALTAHKVPLVRVILGQCDEETAGRLIALLGLATILTGKLMDIDPLDQPAVELGKRLANARLGAAGLEAEKAELAAFLAAPGQSQDF